MCGTHVSSAFKLADHFIRLTQPLSITDMGGAVGSKFVLTQKWISKSFGGCTVV